MSTILTANKHTCQNTKKRALGPFFIEIYLVAKLPEGQSVSQTEHNLSTLINKRFREEVTGMPYFDSRKISVSLRSFEDVIMGGSRSRALLMFAGVLVLVLIAAVNITNNKTITDINKLATFLVIEKSHNFLLASTSTSPAAFRILALPSTNL